MSKKLTKQKTDERSILEDYPEKDLQSLTGFKKELESQIQDITSLFGSLSDVEQKYLGADMIDSISKVSKISKVILSREAIELNGTTTYSFERFSLKELMDLQLLLAGHHGYISAVNGRLKATALLKKAYLEISSTYVYETVYDHIQASYERKPTIPEIEAVIKKGLKEQYSIQRIAAALSVLLDTVLNTIEFIRNVLNSIISYAREDKVNTLHMMKAGMI